MDKTLNRILPDIYRILYERFGPQHWWPAQGPFEVIVGAILTQSTAWTNVEKAIANLKAARKLSPLSLRRIPEAELAALIHSSGYYNVKAKKLKAFVSWFGEQYSDSLDNLFSGDINGVRRELLSVHGIGEETADSILLYAGGRPIFVIDAYTRRIFDRIGLSPEENTYTAYQAIFMSSLPADAALFNEYHALLVKLGKEFCRKRPLCEGCCLNAGEKGDKSEKLPCSSIRNTA
jgi:endonuclease-3 related protein